jgi:outer membrane lipoprotein-sorting protein
MKRTFYLLMGLLLAWMAVPRPAAAADAATELTSWRNTWSQLSDYTCDAESHAVKGDHHEDRQLHVTFKKPMKLRVDVVQGNRTADPGSVAVYLGDNQVHGHQGGMFSGVVLNLGMHDERATSVRGAVITEILFNRPLDVINQYAKRHYQVTVGAPTSFEGHTVLPVTCVAPKNAAFVGGVNDDIYKEILLYDQAQGLPLSWDRYDTNDQKVVHLIFRNIHTNTGVSDNVFDPKAKI